MARFDEYDTANLYATAAKWKDESMVNGASLLWPGEAVWTLESLNAFKSCFVEKPDTTADSFESKFKRQLADQDVMVTKLACEVLLIYFLFAASASVKGRTKRSLISTVAGWKNISVDEQQTAMKCLDRGIGNTGQAYNTRRPFEVGYIATFALDLLKRNPKERADILADHRRVATLLEELEGGATFSTKHILLHLLFPDHFERIASGGHKRRISFVFDEFAGKEESLDERLFAIRRSLENALPGKSLDFYREPLSSCWYNAGGSEELSPLEALGIKQQIVLYGPPGTGKTHEAKVLAGMIVRQAVLRVWKPRRYFTDEDAVAKLVERRVRRIQLHPGYGYEDLVRGLHLVDGGKTAYRSGVLLRIIEDLQNQPPEERDLPFVVILDEMNRADLSKVLGECFSLLEDRDGAIQLAGQDECPRLLQMPAALHFIGTMNLIDQSLEQVDFALRRRFLWFFCGFEREDFLAIAKCRWNEQFAAKRLPKAWDRFEEEFELLADRAEALNGLIRNHHSLGKNYEIGHTYFCDIVSFAREDLVAKPGLQNLLFSKKGDARGPVESLWRYSLGPLLEQYLSGVDETERDEFLGQARAALSTGKA